VVDLDDTTHCPIAGRCEHCGRVAGELGVATLGTPLGVYCATLCEACADPGALGRPPPPQMSWGEAAQRVGEHCEHLGIDLDQMAEALQAGHRKDSAQGGGDA
jgi:hypothetical protein